MNVSDLAFLLAFGIGSVYALYIAVSPFKPEYTWVSVVIGVAMTLGFMGFWEYLEYESVFFTGIVLLFFVMTGIPMVLGQIIKHGLQKREALKLRVKGVPNE